MAEKLRKIKCSCGKRAEISVDYDAYFCVPCKKWIANAWPHYPKDRLDDLNKFHPIPKLKNRQSQDG